MTENPKPVKLEFYPHNILPDRLMVVCPMHGTSQQAFHCTDCPYNDYNGNADYTLCTFQPGDNEQDKHSEDPPPVMTPYKLARTRVDNDDLVFCRKYQRWVHTFKCVGCFYKKYDWEWSCTFPDSTPAQKEPENND